MRTILVLILLCFTNPTYATNAADVFQATCRIGVESQGKIYNIGTGVVFLEDQNDLWIITAGHVVMKDEKNTETKLSVQFFSSPFSLNADKQPSKSKKTPHIKANVFWHSYKKETTTDLAVIKVRKVDLGEWPMPKPVYIAEKETIIRNKSIIVSCGCPNGIEPIHWFGYIKKTEEDSFLIHPGAEPGQSGSGIFTKNGLVGIVIWQDGTSVSLTKIYKEIGM